MRRKRKSKLHGVTNTVQFRQNHFAITNALINLFEEKKHSPTQAEIAKRCNLSRKCVNEHLRELKLEDVTPSIKSETLEILSGLSEKAKTGDPSAVKLWMQLVHGWKEESKSSGYIGIFDSSKCTMEQLERITNGEDPGLVLQNKS